MRDPVVDQERDSRVIDEVEGLFGGRVGGHYDDGARVVRGGWQIGVIHEGDVRIEGIAGC